MGLIHCDNPCSPFSALWLSLDLGTITGRVRQRSFQGTQFYHILATIWHLELHIILMTEGCMYTRIHKQKTLPEVTKERWYFTEETQKLKQLVHLSFSSGSQPRSMLHTGQQSTSSSFIFFIMHSRQTVKGKVTRETLSIQAMQVRFRKRFKRTDDSNDMW